MKRKRATIINFWVATEGISIKEEGRICGGRPVCMLKGRVRILAGGVDSGRESVVWVLTTAGVPQNGDELF